MSLSSNAGSPKWPDAGRAPAPTRDTAVVRTAASRSPPMRKVSKGFGYRETEVSLEEVEQLNLSRRQSRSS